MKATTTISPLLKIGLRLLGIWPGVPYSIVNWLVYMLSMMITQYFQYLYVISHFNISELSNLIDGLPATLVYTLMIFKMINLRIHCRVLHQLLKAMDNDWCECIDIEEHFYVMQIKASISHFCSNAILSFNIISGIVYGLSDYTIHLIYSVDNDTSRQLPIKIQVPFAFEKSPIFELLLAIQFVQLMIHVCAVGVLNGLIFALVLHVSGQIDIIRQEFKNISERISLCDSSAPTLGMLIDKHNKVISFSNNIEKLFTIAIMIQVVWNTLIICILGFIIVISVDNGTNIAVLVKTIFAYVAIMIEPFIICLAGEYLSFKSLSIADAAYDIMWYNMSPSQSKVITFIIMRSHRRLAITAGKMADMSFETFSSMIRASASYMSVLYAMY